jgi:hypothetical protein
LTAARREPTTCVLEELVDGRARGVAFTLPAERLWPLPVYELALMAACFLREHGAGAEVSLDTPEEELLELFGPAAARALEPMLAAGGIRCAACRGCMRLGDAASFPLKQGGLAAQQADAAAEAIASELGEPITPKPFAPIPRGLLMTGGAPLYLRAEPQRLRRRATVAIEAKRLGGSADGASVAGQPLWWPPAKIAGRYLAPYLATARPKPLSSELLTDRPAVPGRAVSEAEHQDALELALVLADCDARWGDYAAALSSLDAAHALQGALPPEYEATRREWCAAARRGELGDWTKPPS